MDKTRGENSMNNKHNDEFIDQRPKEGPMKTYLKHAVKGVLVAGLMVLGLGALEKAQAAGNPDTMTISVTPQVTYAVTITSVNPNGYQFGTIALAGTTISTSAIVVKNSGTIWEYFSMAVSNTSPDAWTPGASGTAGNNQFGLIGELVTNQPAPGGFAAGDALVNAIPGTAATLYGQASTKTAVNATKNLWLELNMPTTLSVGSGGAQTMTLSVNGQGS